MRPVVAIRKHFDSRLRELGFARVRNLGSTWVKQTGPGREVMVDIEKERWFQRIHVFLRRRGGAEDFFQLSDAAGLRGYDYQDDESLEDAVRTAREHFETWGVPWLAGQTVSSPALEELDRGHRRDMSRRLSLQGIAEFKAKAYGDAVETLRQAHSFGELSPVAGRCLELAEKALRRE